MTKFVASENSIGSTCIILKFLKFDILVGVQLKVFYGWELGRTCSILFWNFSIFEHLKKLSLKIGELVEADGDYFPA